MYLRFPLLDWFAESLGPALLMPAYRRKTEKPFIQYFNNTTDIMPRKFQHWH